MTARAAVDDSPFGVSTSASSLRTFDNWGPEVSKTGVKWLRGFDTFEHLEPEQGNWNWRPIDAELAAAEHNKMEISGLFFYGAKWIPSASGLPTDNLPAWSDYVSTVVRHVVGKVRYWEVWNEPPNFMNGKGTPADYARIVNAAYDAAHEADPNCKIGLSAQSNNVNWLDKTLLAGASDHFDYIAVHPYEVLGTVGSGFEGEYMSIVPTLRKMLAARDPSRANAPIWFTEVGEDIGAVNGSVKVTETSQAGDLVKAYTMGLAQGVARINWFEGHDGDSGPKGLLDARGHRRAAFTAMTQLIQYLGPSPRYEGWLLLHNKDYGFVFQGASAPVIVTWAPPGTTDAVDFGGMVEKVDPVTGATSQGSGATLTNAPIFAVGIPAALMAQAQKDKPFPWGGDYTDAPVVSCLMGAPNDEKGLHQLYADARSVARSVDGVTVRDCGKSANQSFTVDPHFLSYTAHPIRITAVVRLDEANASGGFNFRYESTSGWKATGGWTPVPTRAKWTTVSWTIADPQFVGKWGYHFSFDSDSTSHSHYYLQSVTVTKL
jgi:hypothetical protein